jgi:hypothetical protein
MWNIIRAEVKERLQSGKFIDRSKTIGFSSILEKRVRAKIWQK